MKRLTSFVPVLVLVLIIATAAAVAGYRFARTSQPSLAGRYVGYSWQGEAKGTKLADATQYIETILELDEKGIIKDARFRFFVKQDGFWVTRQAGAAYVSVDFSVTPTPAIPGDSYAPGRSMFTIKTADMMSFYAIAVDTNGTVALALVDPITRYQFEIKLPGNFDFSTPFSAFTIGSGRAVPTVRTSTGGLIRPADWATLADKTVLDINIWSGVITDTGILKGVTLNSPVKAVLEALGVTFVDGRPAAKPVKYGYFGIGGWDGNYRAMEAFLIGKDATKLTSLVDWSIPKYAAGINDKNQFGIDLKAGATATVQNSYDGIAGATVRISREATAYQRALVAAGIVKESQVIIGRF